MYWQRFLIGATLATLILAGCSGKDENAFRHADYNKDGKIIFEELIVVYPDLTVEEFLAADANHNGSLDEQELQRFLAARQAGKKLKAPAEAPAAKQPAEAAKPTPATTPQQPGQTAPTPAPAPAATPETSAAPAPSAATTPPVAAQAAPAAKQPEVVTAPAPAPAAPKTYVVARGDTLTRIARRFQVSVTDLVAANHLKNADRLAAGDRLILPSSSVSEAASGTPASPAVTAFVRTFFSQSARGDVNALTDLYADRVNYYAKGTRGRDVVRQDKVAYFLRWPKRTYTPGPAKVSPVSGSDDLQVSVPVTYTVSNGRKQASGQSVFTFRLRPQGKTYRIVGEHSVITKRG